MARRLGLGVVGLAAAAIAACQATALFQPPTIVRAGIASAVDTDGSAVHVTFVSGPPVTLSLDGLRLVTGGVGGELEIIGSDADGPFLAGFTTQDGLPPDCYVDNAQGVNRGQYIELRGILWQKASAIDDPEKPGLGQAYSGGTRFCFGESGAIFAVIEPTALPMASSPDSPTAAPGSSR
jgi:hypothetical protein